MGVFERLAVWRKAELPDLRQAVMALPQEVIF
jgi:hypothetical protein